jgi:hypothetical protein
MRLSPFWLHFNKKCTSEDNSRKRAPGGSDPCSILRVPLIVNILSRIPILELRRLHRGRVSPHFSAAIKRTLGEIALKCQEAILEAVTGRVTRRRSPTSSLARRVICSQTCLSGRWRRPILHLTAAGETSHSLHSLQSRPPGGTTGMQSSAPG